ncbi:hypothetical protein [Brevibacterium marinum]|uniref:Dolichyl-phosphate-mannose-protein mannosyltransferase n=1 Tax=Brevibacterium marinum TaxID=418643 RepID=A0A846S0P3_9MICO|nr:hypothetical protein [Brevibacterium marinum]NJC56523.1 hypothetical protein [Brevibacterium marinum]
MTEPTSQQRSAVGKRLHSATSSALAWDIVLALITVAWSFVFIRLFFPGRVNVDIANQYLQAIGTIPVTDWHPPIMSLVWGALIDLTGQAGSLLVAQVAMLGLTSWLVGVLAHRQGAPRWVSLLGPAVMLTPWVLSQMTTLWKDTQMAVALLLAVVLLIIARAVPKAWVLWIPAVVLLVYALEVRKNAVFAIVPIAIYAAFCLVERFNRSERPDPGGNRLGGRLSSRLRRFSRRRSLLSIAALSLAVLAILGVGVKATDAAIGSAVDVKPTGQISQIFLDDVMFSVPDAQLQASDAPAELKDHISSARNTCLERGEIWDAYWNCYGRGVSGRAFSPIAFQGELKDLWLSEVITHPVRYLEYRTAVFSTYFFTSSLEYWEADWDGDAVKAGIAAGSTKAEYIFKPYVEDFALATFPMLFKPWFWSLLAVVVLGIAWRTRPVRAHPARTRPAHTRPAREQPQRQRNLAPEQLQRQRNLAPEQPQRQRNLAPEITTLATSALCYVFGYFPIVPANHFRYTFWPALAVTVAVVFVLAGWRRRRSAGRSRSSGAPRSWAFSESGT